MINSEIIGLTEFIVQLNGFLILYIMMSLKIMVMGCGR